MTRVLSFLALALCLGCGPLPPPSTTAAATSRVFLLEQDHFLRQGWTLGGDDRAKDLSRLITWAAARGLVIATVDMEDYEGRTDGKLIVLNGALAADDQLYTLIHEIAHCLQPDHLSKPGAETFAELVAVQVYGDDAWSAAANYLRLNVPMAIQTEIATTYRIQIDAVVSILRKAIGS